MLQQRLDTASLLQSAWERGARPAVFYAGPALEAHCFGLRDESIGEWDVRLMSESALESARALTYGRHVCRLLAALGTPRAGAAQEEDPLQFLDNLDASPLQGRPHQQFLEQEATQQARVAAAVAESKKDKSGAGFIQCRRCKSGDVDTDAKQLRSADEPMTVFASCNGCGNRWTLS
jgi:DNA-directed RNA polymerase subunit M/transcription elongation factor TFIIS